MNNQRFNVLMVGIGFFLALASVAWLRGDSFEKAAGAIPILHGGRVKSFESFARETLREITGKERFVGQSAVSFIWARMSKPESFLDEKMIALDYRPLKESLLLDREQKYFSYRELRPKVGELVNLVGSSQKKRDQDERPSALEQKAEAVYGRLLLVDQLSGGDLFKVVPAPSEEWLSPWVIQNESGMTFKALVAQGLSVNEKSLQAWNTATHVTTQQKWRQMIGLEGQYYLLRPFQMGWMIYLCSFILLMMNAGKDGLKKLGGGLLIAGFIYHSVGMVLRSLILERPPVSNMYESIIFMSWILVLCIAGFWGKGKNYFVLTSGSLAAALVLLYGDLLPVEKSLGVLVPVLRSNYWLTLHVLTIVASYGVFGLAMALGHRHIILNSLGRLSSPDEQASGQAMLRLLQLGSLTLGIGTVLGGVWANESWGRFWGWDPKETWALITFLGYMALLHLRYAGKLTDQGLAIGTIIGFQLVLMTWYGVNFLLGRGLHSYGAGAGGTAWVGIFVAVEAVFLLWWGFKKSMLKLT